MSSEFDPSKWVADEGFRAPDLMQAVEGWRTWGVPYDLPPFGVAPKLYSVTYSHHYWVPRQESLAECRRCADNVPGEHCSCGFYSAKTLEHLLSMTYPSYDADHNGLFKVIGQVANWGKVIEASSGWRAQKAYPVHLYVPFEANHLALPLREAYGVPVSLKNWLKPRFKQAI